MVTPNLANVGASEYARALDYIRFLANAAWEIGKSKDAEAILSDYSQADLLPRVTQVRGQLLMAATDNAKRCALRLKELVTDRSKLDAWELKQMDRQRERLFG